MTLDRYEQSAEPRRLTGQRVRRGAQTGLPTWGMMLFGLPFAAVGVVATLIGTKVLPVNSSSVHAPYWVLAVFGVVFFIAGLLVWSMAWRQAQANRRRSEARQRHLDEPAMLDYDWDVSGFEPARWSKAAGAVAAAAGFALFLSIFNWWAFFGKGPGMVKAIVGFFDLILLLVAGHAVMQVGRAFKFGPSRIEFLRFPYRVGEPIVVRWLAPVGVSRVLKGSVTLRCVEEWFESRGTRRERTPTLVHEQKWSGTWFVDQPADLPTGTPVDLSFSPPPEMPATNFHAQRPVFWELEVNLSLPGLDFTETYLVPVYLKK